ncbi:MAG: sigma-70 family RNA polymerase sigma factor [Anaerolineales bacterium]|nr:sigma-70 family RNA polymerase sigma factor [Anaerolineales bacterium]
MLENESAVIQQAQKGDDFAFTSLVEEYQVRVYNLCYRMLGNSGDAEDAAQEVFIRAYNAIKRCDPERKFSTWILTIASNYCIDQYRRKKLPSFSIDGTPYEDIPDRSEQGMDMKIIMSDENSKVRKMLETIKPKDRAVIVMRYWYDYSYEEISDSLNMSVSAVKSRLHRARKDLAQEWLDNNAQFAVSAERKCHEQAIY